MKQSLCFLAHGLGRFEPSAVKTLLQPGRMQGARQTYVSPLPLPSHVDLRSPRPGFVIFEMGMKILIP